MTFPAFDLNDLALVSSADLSQRMDELNTREYILTDAQEEELVQLYAERTRRHIADSAVGRRQRYEFVYPTGSTATLTDAQRESFVRIAQRWNLTDTVEVQALFLCDDAHIVNVGSMWLIVETDGYTHS